MTQTLPYFDPRTLSKLNGVALHARGTVEGAVTGAHRSPFQGFAAEFAEHREYAPGDDLRYVDWKIFGRTDRVFVKQFEEETNFDCHVLLDASESMRFRSESATLSKLEFAKHVAAAISYVVVRQQDACGLMTFDRELLDVVRSGSQTTHWKQISHVLEQTANVGGASRETSPTLLTRTKLANTKLPYNDQPPRVLEPILNEIADQLPRRGIVILLSDLFDDAESLAKGLQRLRHRRHDVRVWQIVDPAEEDFPFDDPTLFQGMEGWPDLPVEPRLLRNAYRREFFAHRESIRRQCRSLRIDFELLRTDAAVEVAVKRCLTGSMRQRG